MRPGKCGGRGQWGQWYLLNRRVRINLNRIDKQNGIVRRQFQSQFGKQLMRLDAVNLGQIQGANFAHQARTQAIIPAQFIAVTNNKNGASAHALSGKQSIYDLATRSTISPWALHSSISMGMRPA